MPPVEGTHPKSGDPIERKPTPKAHAAALVFKIAADQHGDLFFLRVYAGSFSTGKNYQNPRTGERERIIHLYRMYANSREPIKQATPGDIVAVAGLKSCATGDTLCDPKHPIVLEAMAFPETVIAMAIEPKTSQARGRLNEVLHRLEREDPTFQRRVDPETGQTIISGMGELHLEVLKHRMLTAFNVEANVGKPRVSYKETIRSPIDAAAEYHAPADPDRRATVALHLEPTSSAFRTASPQSPTAAPAVDHHADGAPPRAAAGVDVDFAPALRSTLGRTTCKGIAEALTATATGGVLVGYPLVRVHATVTEAQILGGTPGTHAAGDGSSLAAGALLEAAASRALRQGAEQAGIALLEPWMRLEITTPETFLGDILADLHGRRAEITRAAPLTDTPGAAAHLIAGRVPLSSMFGYATALRSLSQGRATFTMEPLEYLPVPPDLAEKFLL